MELEFKEGTGLIIQYESGTDPAFPNLLRRLLAKKTRVTSFERFRDVGCVCTFPLDTLKHAIRMVPIKGSGTFRLRETNHSSGDLAITSNFINSVKWDDEFDIEQNIPLLTLAPGEKVHLEFEAVRRTTESCPELAPFLFRTPDSRTSVLEPLSSVYGQVDCITALNECLEEIMKYATIKEKSTVA